MKGNGLNFLISIIIPTVILMKFSSPGTLGPKYGFCLALFFPLVYTFFDLVKEKKLNFISILGFVSILLTGSIGLLKMSPMILALKEALIPFIIACVILCTINSKYIALRFLFDQIIDLDKVEKVLVKRNVPSAYNNICKSHTFYLSISFFLSSILNFILARMIVRSPGGTTAFAEELGKMTALSYFVIALPSTIILALIFWRVLKQLSKECQLSYEELLMQPQNK